VHNFYLELGWTLFPAFILLLIVVPSFSLLYAMDEVITPTLSIKVIGHQWYWVYELADYEFDSTLLSTDKIIKELPNTSVVELLLTKDVPAYLSTYGDLRLLSTNTTLIVPVETYIRFAISSDDVIHSWAVPSLGIKADAVPGRINHTLVYIKSTGRYYGQCSEICGQGHGFMPIDLLAVSADDFLYYIKWFIRK
jgi:cytochrome c oxidase subunit 2